MSTDGSQTRRKLAFWIVTVPVCTAFLGSGAANLLRLSHVARDMTHLGYPAYFSTILGVWKLLGAIVVAVPGLHRPKEWAYAGMMFDLTGAAISRAVMGDGATGAMPPLMLAMLVAGSWALRSSGGLLEEERSIS